MKKNKHHDQPCPFNLQDFIAVNGLMYYALHITPYTYTFQMEEQNFGNFPKLSIQQSHSDWCSDLVRAQVTLLCSPSISSSSSSVCIGLILITIMFDKKEKKKKERERGKSGQAASLLQNPVRLHSAPFCFTEDCGENID